MKTLVCLLLIAAISEGRVYNLPNENSFDKLYNDLKYEISEATEYGFNHIEPFYQAMVMAGNSNLKKGILELNAITRAVEKEVEDLIIKTPGDTEPCTKTNLEKITDSESEAMYDTRKCITRTIGAMENYFNKAFISFAEMNVLPSEYIIEYDVCDDDSCRGLVEKKISNEIGLIKEKGQKIIDTFHDNMDLIVPGYEDSCVSNLRQNLRVHLGRIIGDITKCLENLN